MSTELYILKWALCVFSFVAFIAILAAMKASADRERHLELMKKEADEAAEREARNRVFPTEGKTVRIWK